MYTIIFMNKDDVTSRPKSLSLPKIMLVLFVLLIVLMPIGAFVYGWQYFQSADLNQSKKEFQKLTIESGKKDGQIDELIQETVDLKTEYEKVAAEKAQAEARVSIAENSRAKVLEKMEELEEEIFGLRGQLAMYEGFFQPNKEKLPIQCFNINVSQSANKLWYGVSFLKANKNDKDLAKLRVEFHVRTGSRALSLEDEELPQSDRVRNIELKNSYRMKGSMAVKRKKTKGGLRMFEIRAYNEKDELMSYCWKSF